MPAARMKSPRAARVFAGLLCLSGNTALGPIERKPEAARAYLDRPPGRLVVVAA